MAKKYRTEKQRKRARRESNRKAQARYRTKQNARGLYQVPIYVALDSRPEVWQLSAAFMIDPKLEFSPYPGCLRNAAGQFTSPYRIINPKEPED